MRKVVPISDGGDLTVGLATATAIGLGWTPVRVCAANRRAYGPKIKCT